MLLPDLTPEQADEARVIAQRLLEEIAPRIIGQRIPPWRCCCGKLSASESTVTKINVPTSADQIYKSMLWRADHHSLDGSESGGGAFDSFSRPETEEIFERHFGSWARRHFPETYAAHKARVDAGETMVLWL